MSDLSIKDLVVEYSSGGYAVRPINGLNLDVAAGSLLILLGPSGCGKTTLLSCLGGILRPKSGAIKFDGVDVTELEGAALAKYRRDKVGIVFQAFNLVPSLTALENVMVPLELRGERDARPRSLELLERVGLADRSHHYPVQLSGGEQQRVALARAFANRPSILFADEPTGNLDSNAAGDLLAFLRRSVRELGQSVVMVTHDPHSAAYADRVVFLADGAVVSELSQPTADSVLERMRTLGA